jgi:two-component system sensor histidine kinase YesM
MRMFYIYLISMSASLVLMGIYFYWKAAGMIESNAGKIAMQTVQQAGKRIELVLEEYENRSLVVSGYEDLQKGILGHFADLYDRIVTNNHISEFLGNMMNSKNDMISLYIYGIGTNSYKYADGNTSMPYVSPAIRQEKWFRKIVQANGRPVWFGIEPPRRNGERPVFRYGRAIKEMNNLHRIIGVMVVELYATAVQDILAQVDFGQNGMLVLVDHDNRVVGSLQNAMIRKPLGLTLPEDEGIQTAEWEDQNMIVVNKKLNNGWMLVGLMPKEELLRETDAMAGFVASLVAVFILVAFLLTLLVSWQLSRPVRLLVNSMEKAEQGSLSVRIHAARNDEFGLLFQRFNTMMSRLKQLIDELYIQRLLQQELRLKMLASQINTHFLYNTLDSIYWISQIHQMEEISDIVYSLSSYYRIGLSEGRDWITVKEAVDFVDHYLSIQKVRFRDRLDVELRADADILDSKVLKYLFQPVVENAIYHGIAKKGKGRLTVSWSRDDAALLFEVTDNGAGIPADKLAGILESIENCETWSEGGNFALKHIHSLIRLNYGDKGRLTLESRPGIGTKVRIRVPLAEGMSNKRENFDENSKKIT